MGLVIAMASNVLTEKDRKEIKLQLRPVLNKVFDEQCVATAVANVLRKYPDLTWGELSCVISNLIGCSPSCCLYCKGESDDCQ